jgi:superfamily I DNA/RNA helicase
MFECRTVLKNYQKKLNYQYIVVDEGQDFSTNAYKLLRLIAGEEHKNDMFIVGDSHQRIYNKKAVLSKCGINVRGRGSILRINYRTTEEIRKYAIALLNGISFDNLDNEEENQDQCQSLTHGDKPVIKNFRDGNEEFDYLLSEINKLKEDGVDLRNICIVARTRKYIDYYNSMFTSKGIRVYEIRGSKVDDRNYDGLRIATMHRVKGLEFQYVFVVACNDRVIPLQQAINIADPISKQESLNSEKCLLYVALTRAQKKAYITSYGNKSEFLK